MAKNANKKYKARKAAQKELRQKFLQETGQLVRVDIEARGLDEGWTNVGTEGHIDHDKERGITVDPKGQKGGRCNVTACQAPGAVFQNVGMISTGGSWYCRSCATDINAANMRDQEREHPSEFTLFPMFDEVLERYKKLRKSGGGMAHDISLYDDINQNPWGSCYHFARDEWLDEQESEL